MTWNGQTTASIKVEFLAGTDIKDAIAQAARLARDLNLAYVKFRFNGVSVSCSRSPDIDKMVEEVMDKMGVKTPHKHVVG